MYRNLKFLHMTDFFSTDTVLVSVTNIRYAERCLQMRCATMCHERFLSTKEAALKIGNCISCNVHDPIKELLDSIEKKQGRILHERP